jgi:metal-sulfur cluster biosynthetic enzyme
MDSSALINANPIVYEVHKEKQPSYSYEYDDEEECDEVTADEIFDHIRNLNDPEHPLTLEQLKVVSADNISVDDKFRSVEVRFTPTIPHCSMATLIGLCIRVKLLRSLSKKYKVTVLISPGTHQSEDAGAYLY